MRARSREWLAREWLALALLVLGAVRVEGWLLARLGEPEEPDEYQAILPELAAVLAPIDWLVPAGEPLVYVPPPDEGDGPVDTPNWFFLIQAVLAPRRIGRAGEARFLIVHHMGAEDLRKALAERHARVLAELSARIALVESEAR